VNDNLEGPVNATAPAPVSNDNFSRILGKILKRPVICSIPDLVVKGALGEMGTEMFLSSAKVMPQILEDRGFEFRYRNLEESLAFQLGK
jgi:NAD dependent epimerase/dehydratase family enzyme